MSILDGAHTVPVDMNAVRVTRFQGVRYIPGPKKKQVVHSDTVLAVRQRMGNAPDLRGIRFGRFTVVGLAIKPKEKLGSDKPAAWVCRCDCGIFEHRRAKAIRNPSNSGDSCQACRQIAYEARRAAYHSSKLSACAQRSAG